MMKKNRYIALIMGDLLSIDTQRQKDVELLCNPTVQPWFSTLSREGRDKEDTTLLPARTGSAVKSHD
jgi:hypothetical protein